jgi:hypothetical protein
MTSVGTYPAAQHTIISSRSAWRTGSPYPNSLDSDVQSLLSLQMLMGWEAAFKTEIVLGWSTIQEEYYRSTNAKPFHNGLRWLSLLIRKLFDISWDLWEHRNDTLHKRTLGIKARELAKSVQLEFELGSCESTRLRLLFAPGMTRICLRQPSQIESWLYQVSTERSSIAQST